MTWVATELAGATGGWFSRLRRSDGLSRIVQAAISTAPPLSHSDFAAVRRLLEDERTWVVVP